MLSLAIAQPTSRPIAQYTNVELIDRLVEIGNDEFSIQTNILPYGDATQGLPQGLRRLGDDGPKPADAMDELVRRGVPAVADLLAHLNDARPTKAVIKGMFGGITYGAEYDWNRRTEKAPPDGVGGDPIFGKTKPKVNVPEKRNEYNLAVGDLCFEIVGKIVGRRYLPVRYQPSAIVIVNSTVLCSDLCDMVRARWTALNVERHRESLIADVSKPDGLGHDVAALPVLSRYYPSAVLPAVRERLQTPIADPWLVEKFSKETVSASSTASFIDSMDEIASPEIDQAVWDAFSKYLNFKGDKIHGTDYVASSVVKRFAHRGHDDELLAYCRRRRGEVGENDRAYFDRLIALLEKKPAD